MGMAVDELDNISLAQLVSKMVGFFEFHKQREEAEWKRTAYISYSLLLNNPYVKPNAKPKSFDEFLNGKTKKVFTVTTEEQFNSLIG